MILTTHTQKAEIAEKILDSSGKIRVEIKYLKTRSDLQNAAMHLYFDLLAKALNDSGYTMKMVLSEYKADINWSKDLVKESIWRPIQKALTKKTSTTELNKLEPGDIYEHINRFTAEKFGISIPFPSIENKGEDNE